MKISPDFHRDVVLADGTHVALRPVRPSDADALKRQFERLSPSSRYRRFLSAATELSDETLRYLTEVDGIDHVAIVATTDSHDLREEVGLGIGRFVRLPGEPDVAEPAITVVDDYQRKGIGRLLLLTLLEAARERGIRAFRAAVLADNLPMRHILTEAGATLREDEGGALIFDIDLGAAEVRAAEGGESSAAEAPAEGSSDNALMRLFKIFAQSLLAIRFPWRK